MGYEEINPRWFYCLYLLGCGTLIMSMSSESVGRGTLLMSVDNESD